MGDSAVHSTLASLLRATEHLKIVISDVVEAHGTGDSTDEGRPGVARSRTGRKGLAVVASGEEQAAILVWQDAAGPVVTQVMPVLASFELSFEQTRKMQSGFLISFSAPSLPSSPASHSPFTSSFSFICDSLTPEITEFIAELKRLHKLAALKDWSASSGSHEWARAYLPLTHRTPLASLNWSLPSPLSPHSPSSPLSLNSPDARASSSTYIQEAQGAMERWLVDRIRERENEFLEKEEIRIWCTTFNVNNKLPKPDGSDVRPWIESSDIAEILVFSFQELDLSAEAMLRYTPYREEAWREAIEAAMGDRRAVYEKLHSRQLVGALILIYVRRDVREHITTVSSNSFATGLMGLMANKGVVGARFRYKDTPLTFLNSHLAAFTQNVNQRNAQVRDTAAQLLFPLADGESRDPWTPNLRPGGERPLGEGSSIWDSGVLVWMGDLNYRVDLPRPEVIRMIRSKEWDLLLRFDQLNIQKAHGLAFCEFEEARIAFPPTFKFDVGTSDYDTGEKQRVPSWTDRILWLSLNEGDVVAESYISHPEVLLSDHKPVSAMLRVPVYAVLHRKRNEVQQEVIAELDKFDNDSLPDVKILPGPSVEFGRIEYGKPAKMEIELANVGQVLSPWSFVLKPGSATLTPPWLHIFPTSGLILPNERTTITLTVNATSSSASSLNFPLPSSEGLSELLVLSIEKKDLFLAVSAREYIPTVFGSSLEHLVRLRDPIRSTNEEERQKIAAFVASLRKPEAARTEQEKRSEEDWGSVSVPRPLHRLMSFLAEHGLHVENLFCASGDAELVEVVRECLDTGVDLPADRLLPASSTHTPLTNEDEGTEKEHLRDAVAALQHLESDIGAMALSATSVPPAAPEILTATSPRVIADEEVGWDIGLHSVADCLLRFLESLEEPVITFALYPRAIRVETRDEAYSVVQDLPEAHANTLLYLMAFLRVLLGQTTDAAAKAARADRLAVVFSAVLLRRPPGAQPERVDPATVPRRKKAFVLMLLQEDSTSHIAKQP
ncbi:hypothetical protein JCM21900_003091 [Sporobolomyces salmonicolor]